jgi:hypothetical protein
MFLTVRQGQHQRYAGLQNAHIWEVGTRDAPGLVGIDRRQLWVYTDPGSASAPVLRLELPGVTKLLYGYWRLIPEEEERRGTISERIEEGKSPLGRPCPRCGGALWLSEGGYGRHYLACTASGCGYRKSLTVADATDLARLMGIRCGKCGQQVRGRSSGGGVFLGCANYPECRWTKSLESLL